MVQRLQSNVIFPIIQRSGKKITFIGLYCNSFFLRYARDQQFQSYSSKRFLTLEWVQVSGGVAGGPGGKAPPAAVFKGRQTRKGGAKIKIWFKISSNMDNLNAFLALWIQHISKFSPTMVDNVSAF